jgi:hypothetical protein
MASILKVDELQGIISAGDITVTSEGGSATQSLQQGLCKVWCNYNESHTVQDSLNTASVTDGGVGRGTVNFSNSANNNDYSVHVSTSNPESAALNGLRISAMATTSYSTEQVNNDGAYADSFFLLTTMHGDLA